LFTSSFLCLLPPLPAAAVENGKCFEELSTEGRVELERAMASDPANSVHQMWVFDSQTMIAIKPKK
jgi:hypothetical protein